MATINHPGVGIFAASALVGHSVMDGFAIGAAPGERAVVPVCSLGTPRQPANSSSSSRGLPRSSIMSRLGLPVALMVGLRAAARRAITDPLRKGPVTRSAATWLVATPLGAV